VDETAPRELTRRSSALAEIAARATYLHERLRGLAPGTVAKFNAEQLLSRWDDALAGDLDRRLAWSGLNRDAALRLMVPGTNSDTRWVDIVAQALAQTADTPRKPRYVDPAAPIAFEDLLFPFVEAGRETISRDLADDKAILAGNVWLTLEHALLALLSRLAVSTFCSEFALYRCLSGSIPWDTGRGETGRYRQFISYSQAGGLRDVFWSYPVLARLLATTVLDWVCSHRALVTRLRDDWPVIQRTFAMNDTSCRVHSIAPYRSDPHDGGQSVAILELSGHLLVYKPRPLGMERVFGDLLAWANARGFSRPYRHTPVLTRDGYGWMGYAAAYPCANAAKVEDFYVRVGGLVCLTALLQGTDTHYENLVASGDQPVLVDAETLFHPRLPLSIAADFDGEGAVDPDDFTRALSDSGWFPPAAGPDFSALGATGSVMTAFPAATCVEVNSDRVTFAYAPFRAPSRQNVPTLNGRREVAASHPAPIVEGFSEMFRLVLRERDSLVDLIRGFRGPPGRFVARSSNTYGLLLQASLSPDALRDGAERGLLFERLRRTALRREERPDHWPILDAETQALERMDVPRVPSTDTEAACCWPSPVRQVTARIARASERDLETRTRQLRHELARLTESRADGATDPETYQEACHGR
jgi:type 2 lantibiotic biosynthesis protein LanM